jgi:hypothetical protein
MVGGFMIRDYYGFRLGGCHVGHGRVYVAMFIDA